LKVATFRESSVDSKKLYIHSGTKTLQLRAHTTDDRRAWLEALHQAKQLASDESSGCFSTNLLKKKAVPGILQETLKKVESLLRQNPPQLSDGEESKEAMTQDVTTEITRLYVKLRLEVGEPNLKFALIDCLVISNCVVNKMK
jgi:hypothetical protein